MSPAAACRSPRPWFAGCALWAVVLWFLSAGHPAPPGAFEIPYFDKVCHFGYFFGGGAMLATALRLRQTAAPPAWGRIIAVVALAAALTGWMDEFHQTFTPGRSGNDPADWLADVLGGTAGALVVRRIFRSQEHGSEKNDFSETGA